jgi:hypothetical protein
LENFGRTVADYVAVMTKDMRLEECIREIEYDKQLAEGPWQGRLIKLADVFDNFADSPQSSQAKFVEKAERILTLTQNDEQLKKSREALLNLIKEKVSC